MCERPKAKEYEVEEKAADSEAEEVFDKGSRVFV